MLRKILIFLPLLSAACGNANTNQAVQSMNAVDQTTMSEIMLTVGEPQEAVNYFTRTTSEHPDRIDQQRGLAKSLVRNGQITEGVKVWNIVTTQPTATNDDRVSLAEAQIRSGNWQAARATLGTIPPTFESYDRYRIEAMVADSEKNWKKADSFYDTAAGLTTRPAGILNNWGFSKLSRGDPAGAEKLFAEAITYDPTSFTSKNNLVLARAAQRKYDMPVVDMTQTERAQMMYTAALSALKQGDAATGKSLLQDAVDTSPVYFEEAARALAALDETPKVAG
ncbi:MAG TPA: hypothetical protein VGC40_12350 [Paenirhodobacter sp.]